MVWNKITCGLKWIYGGMKNNYSGMKLNISGMKSQNNLVLTQI